MLEALHENSTRKSKNQTGYAHSQQPFLEHEISLVSSSSVNMSAYCAVKPNHVGVEFVAQAAV
jgi:hypothetical protein